jgi:membrane protein required for beta-lactamase induction
MRGVIILLTLVLSGCVGYREKQVEFETTVDADARAAREQCRLLARNLVQIARCDGR